MTESHINMPEEDIQFTAEERSVYRRPDRTRLLVDLTLPWVQIFIGCALFMVHPAIWTWLIAIIIIAGGQGGLAAFTHEAVHRLIWPQNKQINDRIATYFFAAPVLLPFKIYRQRHLIHHRLVSLPGDTKNFYRRDLRGTRLYAEIARSLSGVDYLVQAIEALRAGKGDNYNDFSGNLRSDQRSILVVHAVLFLVFTAFDPLYYGIPTYYILLWLWPLLTVSFLIGKLRSLVEHQPPLSDRIEDPDSPYLMKTPAPLLRSVEATLVERLFMSKINFHYHAEHHLWPWVSYQYLPQVNAKLWRGEEKRARLINGHMVIFDKDYFTVLGKVFRGK